MPSALAALDSSSIPRTSEPLLDHETYMLRPIRHQDHTLAAQHRGLVAQHVDPKKKSRYGELFWLRLSIDTQSAG